VCASLIGMDGEFEPIRHASRGASSAAQVKSIAIDPVAVAGHCKALVRLQPPRAPGSAATEAAPSAGLLPPWKQQC